MPSLRRFPPAGAVTLLLVLFASSTHAQDPGRPRATRDERSARVDEALRLSDLKARLSAIRARLLGYLDTTRTSDEARQWAVGSLKAAYRPDVYGKAIKQALLDDYRDETMSRVLAWYRSPVGRKIAWLEKAAQETGQDPARREYLAGLEERQPSDYRLVLIWSIDEASRTSAATASALRASINGWSLGLEQLAERPEAREIASDGDLRAYAEFLESDAGRWFVGTVFKTHQAYFDDAANQVAEDLVSTATRKQAVPPSLPARR